MASCTYIVPLVYTEESNETLIAKKTIRVLPCIKTTPEANILCGLWNLNRCNNDSEYCNPFLKGDLLYFQYIFNAKNVAHATFEIVDNTTGFPIELGNDADIVTAEIGTDENRTNFLNIIIDTSKFDLKCFYIKLNVYKCRLSENEAFINCVADKIEEGLSSYFANLYCYEEMCTGENVTNIYSEPYCVTNSCERTILIEGFYPKYDCNGNFYGLFTGSGANSYKPSIRIRGEIEKQNMIFEETLTNRKRTKSRQSQVYIMQTSGLPEYVVDRIALCWNSQNLFIDGVEYLHAVKLEKNNEEGTMWYLKETLTRECEQINFTCT